MRMALVAHRLLVVLAVVLCALAVGVVAYCPGNGNTHVIYLTSNMGDNIWSFDTMGHFVGNVLNKQTFPFRVDKLRDMKFGPGGHLYISSARGRYSRIFAVSGNGLLNNTLNQNCTRDYLFTVTMQSKKDPFLDHPYSIAFNPDDDSVFVSNQNSVTVTKYTRKVNMTAAGASEYVSGRFPEWAPAPNTDAALPKDSTEVNIPSDAGLFASGWSAAYSMLSVRGMALSPRFPRALIESAAPAGLYATEDAAAMARYVLVCDIAVNQVHVFHAQTGERLFALSVPSPVQVLFPSRFFNTDSKKDGIGAVMFFDMPYIYVTSKEDGMAYLVPFVAPQQSDTQNAGAAHTNPAYPITTRLAEHSSSGIYENPSHDMLLIADRGGRKVSTYASPFQSKINEGIGPSPFLGYFVSNLPDQPEFVLTTMVEHQSSIPFCYELNVDGTFRYVALCTAAYIWTLVLIVCAVVGIGIIIVREVRHWQEVCKARKKKRRQHHVVEDAPSSEEMPLVTSKTAQSSAAAAGYGTST